LESLDLTNNPICQIENYKDQIRAILPKLDVLDGFNKEGQEFISEDEEDDEDDEEEDGESDDEEGEDEEEEEEDGEQEDESEDSKEDPLIGKKRKVAEGAEVAATVEEEEEPSKRQCV
jgi:hypothetical protein